MFIKLHSMEKITQHSIIPFLDLDLDLDLDLGLDLD